MNIKHKVIHVPKREIWLEDKEEFIEFEEKNIEIEHCLYSISLWEAKYHKSYFSTPDKTAEEILDYMKMMVLSGLEDEDLDLFFLTLPIEVINEINEYMNDEATATTFSKEDKSKINSGNNEIITSEIVYYWMTTQNIPFECEMWHINRLITLIRVCIIKNQPEDKKKKKLTSSDIALRRARMQAARAKYKH